MCDFGFAKKVYADRTYTRCGTPDYTSPEMLQGEGVNQAILCSLLDACLWEWSSTGEAGSACFLM